jgi:hypothetical protein
VEMGGRREDVEDNEVASLLVTRISPTVPDGRRHSHSDLASSNVGAMQTVCTYMRLAAAASHACT